VSRTFYVDKIKLVWQANGRQVSVITDTKQNTQIINYIMRDQFPSTSTKFPPGSKIIDFAYSFDAQYCVGIVQTKQAQTPSVYLQKTNSDDKPVKIISLEAERIFFCPQTNVFAIQAKSIDDRSNISFIDIEQKCYLATYEFKVVNLAFDPYGRYLAVLDSTPKGMQLNIIDCVGQCMCVKDVPDAKNFEWRPEDKEFISAGNREEDTPQDEELMESTYKEHCEVLKEQNTKRQEERYQKKLDVFNKAFNQPGDISFAEEQQREFDKLVKKLCPEQDDETEEIDFQVIRRLNQTSGAIT